MKSLFFTFAIQFFLVSILLGQTTIRVIAADESVYVKTDKIDTTFNYIIVRLTPSDFSSIKFIINKRDTLGFTEGNSKKGAAYIRILSQDICEGEIKLKFKDKKLVAIGERLSPYLDDILTGKDSMVIKKSAKDSVKFPISFLQPSKPENKSATLSFNSKFCIKNMKDTSINGIPDFTFLCDNNKIDSSCKCGTKIKNGFENIYLPPCFDKNGNALSISQQLYYNTIEKDGLKKLFLFDINKTKNKKDSSCKDLLGSSYQFASIQRKIKPKVGELLAITVVAHKDSVIILDSNYVNYFLDSAMVFQNGFSGTGTTQKIDSGDNKSTGWTQEKTSSTKNLQLSITLQNDLYTWNQRYQNSDFVMEKYLKDLLCMQLKIVEWFYLNSVPNSGMALATALEKKLIDDNIDTIHFGQVCRILNSLAEQYDIAISKNSNYRTFTQVLQVPNADELNISLRTKNTNNAFYNHNFLIKGGWKIDFSSGVILTGLNNVDYIQKSVRLNYKIDSASSEIRDTTGQTIAPNKNKMNYNLALLAHLYRRSGNYFNWGFATGVTFNNSDFMMMFGGSGMFRMGNGRLAFVGGLAFGRQKALDANQEQYTYTQEKFNDSKIYTLNASNTGDRLPRFFTDTNISTYEKLKASWFVGITYNFASIKL